MKKNNFNESLSHEFLNEESIMKNYLILFVEIAPLNFDIDNQTQKDLSSVPLNGKFPKLFIYC